MTSTAQTPENKPDSTERTARPKQKKARSSAADALKHGLATDLILVSGEDGREFEEFATKIVDDLQPQGALERALTDQIVTLFWRLKRVPVLEAAVFNAKDATESKREAFEEKERTDHLCAMAQRYLPKDRRDPPDSPAAASEVTEQASEVTEHNGKSEETTDKSPDARVGRALIYDSENTDALGKLLRMETALSNTLDRTMSRLFTLQSARGEREPPRRS